MDAPSAAAATSPRGSAWCLASTIEWTGMRKDAPASRQSASRPPGTKAQPLASSADATHDLLPLGFGACEFFVRQLLLARGSRFVELPLSSFVFNRGGRR